LHISDVYLKPEVTMDPLSEKREIGDDRVSESASNTTTEVPVKSLIYAYVSFQKITVNINL